MSNFKSRESWIPREACIAGASGWQVVPLTTEKKQNQVWCGVSCERVLVVDLLCTSRASPEYRGKPSKHEGKFPQGTSTSGYYASPFPKKHTQVTKDYTI